MIEMCPTCGLDRRVDDTGPGWVVWVCELCGVSREEVVEP